MNLYLLAFVEFFYRSQYLCFRAEGMFNQLMLSLPVNEIVLHDRFILSFQWVKQNFFESKNA